MAELNQFIVGSGGSSLKPVSSPGLQLPSIGTGGTYVITPTASQYVYLVHVGSDNARDTSLAFGSTTIIDNKRNVGKANVGGNGTGDWTIGMADSGQATAGVSSSSMMPPLLAPKGEAVTITNHGSTSVTSINYILMEDV